MKHVGPDQLEFLFYSSRSELCGPPTSERVLCVSTVPEQHSQPLGRCFADEPNCKRLTPGGWPRPDFRPLTSTKKLADPQTPKASVVSQCPQSKP
jgi:hypothetical protein